ncbi:MAG: hypothetical protein K2P60_12565, partial [Lachnospiraceae bacterium]|nr:hypothetical protein [Lachnospiraceae bacterium]
VYMSYHYNGEQGDFCLKNPEKTSYLYFPLANEQGIKSCVTPDLGGDLKTGHSRAAFFPGRKSRRYWKRELCTTN